MKIVSSAEMREIDRATTEKFHVPSLVLMENAGSAVADHILQQFPNCEEIVVVCGKGNNGGDGFVAARKLHEAGKNVSVFLLGSPSEVKGDAAAMLAKLPIKLTAVKGDADLLGEAVSAPDLIVDAILGTGFRPPVSGLYATAISLINESDSIVVSVDVPSGADADAHEAADGPIIEADAIVTFTALKPAHIFQFTEIPTVVREIGSPPEAIASTENLNLITPEDIAHIFAPRRKDAHKGIFGHALITGGSVGKAGAVAMAGMAALRSGAGLVTLAVPQPVLPIAASFAPELMVEPLPNSDSGFISMLALERMRGLEEGKSVIAIGPGLSQDPGAAQFARALVEGSKVPTVLDADGLNAFKGHADGLSGNTRPLILTPHPAEMARLAGMTTQQVQADRIGVARRFAQQHKVFVVLKGHRTVVAEPDGKIWINTTGNPGMATGGTGDILTGIVSALVAQNLNDVATAVIAAVHLHGLAGDIACEEIGEMSMTATDLLGALPQAIRRLAP